MSAFSSSSPRIVAALSTCASRSARRSATIALISAYLRGCSDLEGEVLELPLERVDPEAVRERRVDLERLLRLLHLLLLAEVLDRAHVVEPVGELDQDDPHVLRHRDDHLPVVLRLRLLAARNWIRVSLVTPSTSCAISGPNSARSSSSSTSVSSTTSWRSAAAIVCSSRWSSAQMLRDAARMVDELLAGAARLAAVAALGELERTPDAGRGRRPGCTPRRSAISSLDEVLVVLLGVDDGHSSVYGPVSSSPHRGEERRGNGRRMSSCGSCGTTSSGGACGG